VEVIVKFQKSKFFALLMVLIPPLAGAESLYREASFRSLTSDNRAYRAGDVLTVLVVENASASASANTTTEKRGGIGVSLVLPTQILKSGGGAASVDLNSHLRRRRPHPEVELAVRLGE